jgi:hypothetical protein
MFCDIFELFHQVLRWSKTSRTRRRWWWLKPWWLTPFAPSKWARAEEWPRFKLERRLMPEVTQDLSFKSCSPNMSIQDRKAWWTDHRFLKECEERRNLHYMGPFHYSLLRQNGPNEIMATLSLRSFKILSNNLYFGVRICFISFGLLSNILYRFVFSHIHANLPTHRSSLDLNFTIIFDEYCKSCGSSLLNYLQTPVTSLLFGANNLLSTLFYVLHLMSEIKFWTYIELL